MAKVYKDVEKWLARDPAVVAAVRALRDEVAAVAETEFASHDRPSGHRIVKTNGRVNAYVWLEGPNPLAVEYGHALSGSYAHKGVGPNKWVQGLFIMTKAAQQV